MAASLNDLFGFKESVFTYDHYLLELNRENKANRNFNEKEEQLLYLKNPTTPVKEEGMLKTWNYSGFTGDILAAYEDGRPAIIQNHVGKGQAVAFGFDLGIFLANCYASNVEVWGNRYVNGFIPTADVFLRLIKELYLQGEPNAVIIGTVPDNKSLSVIFSHDVTSRSSMDHVVDYAKYEHGEGFSATYYIVTKYLSDYNDVYFFDADAVSLLNKISSMGMEVASHTVAHSLQFSAFPIGTGKEKYPTYRPIAMNIKITEGGSVMGELRVSKFLLEKLVDSTHVTSFRSGFLEEPRSLPQVLEATGYLFNTSTTANSTWSHLPFQLNYDYGRGGEVNIFQFPITIEDQMLPRMDKRIHEGIALAKKIASYGGICVILIHPEVVGYKLKFEKEFVKGVKEFSWFGSIEMFGKWWAARNAVSIDVTGTTGKKIVSLKIPKPLQGFSLMLPSQWTFEHAEPHNETISQQKETLFIGEAQEEMKLFFTMISSPGPV